MHQIIFGSKRNVWMQRFNSTQPFVPFAISLTSHCLSFSHFSYLVWFWFGLAALKNAIEIWRIDLKKKSISFIRMIWKLKWLGSMIYLNARKLKLATMIMVLSLPFLLSFAFCSLLDFGWIWLVTVEDSKDKGRGECGVWNEKWRW